MYAALASLAEEAIIEACWAQWQTLVGESADSHEPGVIDPEALVLASLALRVRERRLTDRLAWWAAKGSKLLSVQRMASVKAHFPASAVESGMAWFASEATRAGDARWKKLASGEGSDEPVRIGKGPIAPNLLDPSTLMLSLRAGFGVGAKADLLSYLIGTSSSVRGASIEPVASKIALALSYSPVSIRRAAGEMVLARFIEATTERPPRYSVDEESWAQAINLYDPRSRSPAHELEWEFDIPTWRFWSQKLGFLVACSEWGHEMERANLGEVVAASRARDIVEATGRVLAWLGVEVPDARHYAGPRYLEAFERVVSSVAAVVRS